MEPSVASRKWSRVRAPPVTQPVFAYFSSYSEVLDAELVKTVLFMSKQ